MKLSYDLTIEQTQKLSMTPELIQAIQILQYNNQELDAFVQNELLENPILEAKSESTEPDEISAKDIDLPDIEVEKVAEEPDFDLRDKIVEAGYDDISYNQWQYNKSPDDEYTFEQFVSQEVTLGEYLYTQLQFTKLKDRQVAIGRCIIEALDDNGYLTLTVEEIAELLRVKNEDVEYVLDVVQTFEPSGVAARNLRECLMIQLAAKGELTEEIEYVIENLLEDLANNKLASIAKTLGITTGEVQEISDAIKRLEPKPGREFASGESTRYVVPDIFVEKVNDEYVVTTNQDSVPNLMVSSYYSKLSEQAKSDQELGKYLSDRFNSAVWLIKSIEQRKQTIYNVASAVVKYQKDFFEKGEKYLKTLTLKQIADEVGMHESTVSRSINGKYMQSPRGVYEMKFFFSSGVSGEDGTGVSSNSIKSIIKDMVDKEDPTKPLSDQDMAEMLSEKGIAISRRTVAKYREGMNILSSSKRRRF